MLVKGNWFVISGISGHWKILDFDYGTWTVLGYHEDSSVGIFSISEIVSMALAA